MVISAYVTSMECSFGKDQLLRESLHSIGIEFIKHEKQPRHLLEMLQDTK